MYQPITCSYKHGVLIHEPLGGYYDSYCHPIRLHFISYQIAKYSLLVYVTNLQLCGDITAYT